MSLLAVAVAVGSSVNERPASPFPASLAGYRSWRQPSEKPVRVPGQTWALCVAPSVTTHGPHADRFIRVYINPAGQGAFRQSSSSFPIGTIIAKEKLLAADSKHAEGVGFMVKRPESEFSSSGGWQFLYYPETGSRDVVQEHCSGCHRNAQTRDYVFGRRVSGAQ